MEINFHLSVDDILQRVYAMSAIHSYSGQFSHTIPLLTPDHRKALRILIGDSFCAVALAMGERVTACSLPEETALDDVPADTMDLTLRCSGGAVAPVMRGALESAVASMTLRDIYATVETELSNSYSNRTDAAISKLRLLADSPDCPMASIMPHY